MPDAPAPASTRNSQLVKAPPAAVYAAFMDPAVLVQWLPPAEMTGQIHAFDAAVGGGYRMSLFYPAGAGEARGKTTAQEDQVEVRFVALEPGRRIVEAVAFVSDDPKLKGEMSIEISFEAAPGGTEVTFLCTHLPPGLRPKDNEEGARLSLAQLARRFA